MVSQPSVPSTPIGLFIQLDRAPDVSTVYSETLDLIVAAEELGYSAVRVAQHHFGMRYGRLPSPIPFLVAAAHRTRRIRLGTAVITVPFEHPIRLAEDAAVADVLMNARLELGLGSGYDPGEFLIFGVDAESRRGRTSTAIEVLQRALRGEPFDDQGTQLYPPAPGLLDRLWLAAMSVEGARYAAQLNMGILLARVERGTGAPTENQTHMTDAYRAALAATGRPARIVAGRTVYVADDRVTAQRDLTAALAPLFEEYVRKGLAPAVASWEERLTSLHILHGHPEEIIPILRAEQAAIGWTELMVQVDPGDLPPAKAIRALERFAGEVAPYLGGGS